MALQANKKKSSRFRLIKWIISVVTSLIVAIGGLAEIFSYACDNGIICPVNPSIALFSAYPTTGTSPLHVNINDLSTGKIQKYIWDFGDGTGSQAENPGEHWYGASGEYTITLKVEGVSGTDEYQITITVLRSTTESTSSNNTNNSTGNSVSNPLPTNIPSIASAVLFCLQEPTAASGYACANPVSQLPSGISRFYYSRSFANIPIGTRIYSRWYRDSIFLPILERTITYEGNWVTSTGFQYSWVQEVEGFDLVDGLYTVEVFVNNDNIPDQTGSVRIGGN